MILVKLRTRIVIGLLIIVGAGFYYMTNWVLHELRPHYLKSMEATLVDISTLLSSLAVQEMVGDTNVTDNLRVAFDDAGKRNFSARIYDYTKKKMILRVYITDAKGIVLFDSENGKDEGKNYSKWNDVHLTLKGKYGARSSRSSEGDPTSSWLYVASPIIVNGDISGVLSVGKPAKSVNLFVVHAKNKIIIAGLIASICVIILGIFLSTWVTWPIRKLTDYARDIRDGKHVALPQLGTMNQRGHSEIGIMGSALEEMRDALEGKKYIENYVQTLTHEIKSPLSAIRGASELIEEDMPKDKLKQFIHNIKTETNRIQSFIDRLLELSSIESRKELKDVEEIDVSLLISEVTQSLAPLAEAGKITFKFNMPDNCTVNGEKFLVRQALANLLRNSIDFTPKDGEINISVQTDSDTLSIIVDDTGPGIPDYAKDKIFNRFYSLNRPGTKLKSTGLGLSFVKEVASLHKGDITIENRQECGASATLSLPLYFSGS